MNLEERRKLLDLAWDILESREVPTRNEDLILLFSAVDFELTRFDLDTCLAVADVILIDSRMHQGVFADPPRTHTGG